MLGTMHARGGWVRGLVVVVWMAMAVPAGAGLVQVTDLPLGRSVSNPSISGDGRFIVITSSGNLGGVNPSQFPNVMVYDALNAAWSLVTTDTGFDPTISADGRWVAFTSGADYARRNADGSDEIFRFDRKVHRFLQVTRDINGDGASELPVISGDGKRIAFETSSNLRGRNPDFSNEVYLFNRTGNSAMSRDPEGDGESHTPVVSADGTFVVFTSSSNLTNHNPNFGTELMLYDVKKRDLSQVTYDPDGNGDVGSLAISADARFVLFVSSLNIAALNPDNCTAMYLMNRPRHDFSVVNNSPDGFFDADLPSISDDGRWIAFLSGADITQGNPDHNAEVMLYDRARKTYTQITDSTGCRNDAPKITGDGTRIVLLSKCNYTGGNPDGSFEVFLADNPALNLNVHSEGPVSLELTDPNGLSINKTSSTIPRASYTEGDFDNDTIPEDRVVVPQAVEGIYQINILADPAANPTDPVTLEATLNDLTVPLATGTIATLGGRQFIFSNQGFSRRTSRITPLNGAGSRLYLTARLRHEPATSGPVRMLFDDGTNQVSYDFGQIEDFGKYPVGRTFNGGVNGFFTQVRISKRPGGTGTVSLLARDGDLSMFDGTGDLSMTIVVQIGNGTDMYHFRFKRRVLTGQLILQ